MSDKHPSGNFYVRQRQASINALAESVNNSLTHAIAASASDPSVAEILEFMRRNCSSAIKRYGFTKHVELPLVLATIARDAVPDELHSREKALDIASKALHCEVRSKQLFHASNADFTNAQMDDAMQCAQWSCMKMTDHTPVSTQHDLLNQMALLSLTRLDVEVSIAAHPAMDRGDLATIIAHSFDHNVQQHIVDQSKKNGRTVSKEERDVIYSNAMILLEGFSLGMGMLQPVMKQYLALEEQHRKTIPMPDQTNAAPSVSEVVLGHHGDVIVPMPSAVLSVAS